MNVIDQCVTERFSLYHGDCVEVLKGMPSESVDYSIFSPPFAQLYCYSASERDGGNCKNEEEFHAFFRFVMVEIMRVLKPGRNVSIHCMDLPLLKERDGVIGLSDFRGDLIRYALEIGWIYHSNVTIWRDPVVQMQRTHALGLLYKQLRKDSLMSRMALPDYLVTLRKPGENREPVTHTHESFPVSQWQKWASPVWMDINPSDTLQKESAREEEDERHVCPLQLEVIRRGIRLWSNPGDIVLTPFLGIGSEMVVALEEGRRGVGIELKGSYYKQAEANCHLAASQKGQQHTLFAAEEGTP